MTPCGALAPVKNQLNLLALSTLQNESLERKRKRIQGYAANYQKNLGQWTGFLI